MFPQRLQWILFQFHNEWETMDGHCCKLAERKIHFDSSLLLEFLIKILFHAEMLRRNLPLWLEHHEVYWLTTLSGFLFEIIQI